MFKTLQNPLAMIGRLLLAWLFLPAGIAKISGFAGTVGYAASAGLPMPQLGTAVGLVLEIVGGRVDGPDERRPLRRSGEHRLRAESRSRPR